MDPKTILSHYDEGSLWPARIRRRPTTQHSSCVPSEKLAANMLWAIK
ncbi:hypothetical protein SAMN05192544_108336 [Paraburkholderia hospita]|nr:hypothetical protein SAMN05192544_108336 [Paraburkholderia hospita]